MKHPHLWKWLHRIGYICTVLVVLETIFFGWMFEKEWASRHEFEARARDDTRTHDGPLQGGDAVRADAFRLFKPLPSLKSLGGDGFHFAAMPQLAYFNYSISLGGIGEEVQGVLLVREMLRDSELPKIISRGDHGTQYEPPVPKYKETIQYFTMPRAAYRDLMAKMDALTDGFG